MNTSVLLNGVSYQIIGVKATVTDGKKTYAGARREAWRRFRAWSQGRLVREELKPEGQPQTIETTVKLEGQS